MVNTIIQALVKSMREANLLQRVLTPDDVAQTILSIVQNRVMTGELIRLDAGAHIGKANFREVFGSKFNQK